MFGASVFWGLSFLSRGPISVHALWLPFLISYVIIYKFRGLKKRRAAIILFFVIGLVLGGWWFVYVCLADPASFVRIMDQETEAWKIHRPRPFYYYWPLFIPNFLPPVSLELSFRRMTKTHKIGLKVCRPITRS